MNDYACLPSLASAIPSPWKICSSLLSLVEPSWKLLSPFEGMTPQASGVSDVYLMHPSGCGEMKWLFHFKEKAQSPNLWPRSQNANTYSLALGNPSFYDLRFPFGVEMAFLFLPKVLWIRWPKENLLLPRWIYETHSGSHPFIQHIHSFSPYCVPGNKCPPYRSDPDKKPCFYGVSLDFSGDRGR